MLFAALRTHALSLDGTARAYFLHSLCQAMADNRKAEAERLNAAEQRNEAQLEQTLNEMLHK